VNPESIRLNPKIKSNLPPTKRINGNWVKKIAMPLKIFSFGSYKYNLIVRKYALNCLLYSITLDYTAYYPLYNTESLISLGDFKLHPLIHTLLESNLAQDVESCRGRVSRSR